MAACRKPEAASHHNRTPRKLMEEEEVEGEEVECTSNLGDGLRGAAVAVAVVRTRERS